MICGTDPFLDCTVVTFGFWYVVLRICVIDMQHKRVFDWIQNSSELVISVDTCNFHASTIVDSHDFGDSGLVDLRSLMFDVVCGSVVDISRDCG